MEYLVDKLVNLRVFDDSDGKMNLSLENIKGELLIISQFTLYGNTEKGRRPSYINAASPEISKPLYEKFIKKVQEKSIHCISGEFGAHMDVELVNNGPVTLILEK